MKNASTTDIVYNYCNEMSENRSAKIYSKAELGEKFVGEVLICWGLS